MKYQLEDFLQIIMTMISRGLSALGAITFIYVIAMFSGTKVVGITAILHSIVIGVSILCVCGTGTLVMRVRSSSEKKGHAIFQSSIRLALVLSLFFLFFLSLFYKNITSFFLNQDELIIFFCYIYSIPAIAAGLLVSGYLKGSGKPSTAVLYENGLVYLVASIILVYLNLVNEKTDLMNVGISFLISAWIVAVFGLVATGGKFWVLDREWRFSNIFSESKYYLGSDLTGYFQSNALFIIAGQRLDNDTVGIIRIIERVSSLISFALIAVNAVYARKFSSLYYQNNISALSNKYRESIITGLSFGIPLFLIVFSYPEAILLYFDINQPSSDAALRVYSLAALFNVLTGSVVLLLSVSNQQRFVYYASLFVSFSGLIFFWWFSAYGLMASVIIMSLILVIKNIIMIFKLLQKFGITFLFKRFE